MIVGYILAAASTSVEAAGCQLLERGAEAVDKVIAKGAQISSVTQVLEQQLGMPVRRGTTKSEDKVRIK